MNELKIFVNEEFGQVRTILINNESWFVGKDVATALGYANPKNAVPKHVSDEDKLSTQIEYAGQRRTVTVINESGLYALIFGSKLESAKKKSIRYVPSTNKIRRTPERANLPSKKGVYSRSTACFMGGIQPVTYSL